MKLHIQAIEKSFGDKEVLKQASFVFDQGKIYALLGRNGSGKTTLFSLIARHIKADSGAILLEDQHQLRPVEEEDLFFMIAEPKLPNFLTGREFIQFYMDANQDRITSHYTIDQYFDGIELDLQDRDRLIQDYSTGMKNKLQMLMFLITQPKIILMDEPLTSLDIVVQYEIKKILKDIQKDHIILFSTHIMQLAQDLCDDIVLLIDGQLEELDFEKLKEDPHFENHIIERLKNPHVELGNGHEENPYL